MHSRVEMRWQINITREENFVVFSLLCGWSRDGFNGKSGILKYM